MSVDRLSDEIMNELTEYVSIATDDMKHAVTEAGKTVLETIQEKAPVDTGTYKKSWTVTKESESAEKLSLVVYSKTRYRLTHLLEFGHAKRGGGRVKGQAHIAPAEEAGKKELLSKIEEAMKK